MEHSETRPAASWVLGRSARWHTAEGAAMLAEDGTAEDLRHDASVARAISVHALRDPTGPGLALWVIDLLLSIAWRTFRRGDD